jgi:putative transposase
MARIARVVVPGLRHHASQRGNRREPVFSVADDYRLYRRLVGPKPQVERDTERQAQLL